MKRRIVSLFVVLAMTMPIVCGALMFTASAAESGATVVRLDPSEASPFNNGEFEGWGTSMGWWGNRIGYSDKLAEQAAELFYSEEGLGLDIVRYNVGGGDQPGHNHVTRSDSKLPCFAVPELNADNTPKKDANGNFIYTYNWDADYNQVNVLTKIKEQNDNVHIEGYTNSPPWFMTNSLCSGGGVSGAENLDPANYDDFAEFIVEVTKHFEEEGLKFDSYSPMNEPEPRTGYWQAYSVKQEGNLVAPGEHQSGLINALKNAYKAADIDTLVAGPDETDIGYTISSFNSLNDEAKTNLDRLDTHTYGGSNRAGLKATALAAGKNLWMSEVDGGWNGFGLAQRIIDDLNGMQASAWVMWDIVDMHKDSKFTDPSGNRTEANASLNPTGTLWGVAMANHDIETIELANKYYAYGQFTKYINPGDTLIASSNSTLAAYNRNTGDIKIVALNSSGSDAKYLFDLSAFEKTGGRAKVIRSNNSNEKWKDLGEAVLDGKKLFYTLPAQSITTFVIENNKAVIDSFTADENGLSYEYSVAAEYEEYDKYLAVFDSENRLKYVSSSSKGSAEGDFTGCTPKLYIWDGLTPVTAITDTIGTSNNYAVIKGGSNQLKVGSSIALTVGTNIDGDITWSSSDNSIASVTEDGLVTANASGSVTIYASVGGFTTSRDFEIPMYSLSGTPSWGNDSNRPADSADYTKAVDGDLSTYFDGTTGGYVQYDYGEPFKPSAIKLAARSGNGMPERTVGGVVQASSDGITWTDLFEIRNAIPADEYTTISASNLKSSKAYRYFRYTNEANMANIAEFLIEGAPSSDVPSGDPVVTDLKEFTDSFESSANIFGAKLGSITDGGNVVFPSELDRFGNVFAPVKDTASAALEENRTLSSNELFRLDFTMFSGWENNGRENTFALKDAEGNEIIAIYITGGGYNLNQIRIDGENVLAAPTVAQSRSNPGTNKAGANGWNASGQPYVNTVGYNKSVEILIEGTGRASVSVTGGIEDTTVSGFITTPITLGSLELTGDYNAATERTVSYDNFDADIITYSEPFAAPTPTPEPTPTPKPTDPPVLPESGELINMNFDNGDLTSTSSYGKASGTPKFVTVDGKQCIQLDGSSTAVKLTDANGNALLTGQKNITISLKVKPTSTGTSWWLFAAPNDSAQTYQQEKYIGILGGNGTVTFERYNNSGSRSTSASGEYKINEWNDLMISVGDDTTAIYVNGKLVGNAASTVNISDMLGGSSVAYIGRANWGSGEYAAGYIDDFVIYNYSVDSVLSKLDLGDLTAVTEDITLPSELDGSAVKWTTSDASVVTDNGKITRADEDKTAAITAAVTVKGIELTKSFNVTVKGYTSVLDSFAAYAENDSILFTSDYSDGEKYAMHVSLADSEDKAAGETKVNTASGSFDGLGEGTYKIKCTLTDGNKTVKETSRNIKVKAEEKMGAYLFVHFIGTESDESHEQIYFSVSENGADWTTLNGGKPILTSSVGEKGVRDPYVLRGEDGKYFIIATDLSIYNRRGDSNRWSTCQTSGSKSIVVWESTDLVNWSEANLVKVAVDNAGCTWAPEAVYDPEEDKYMVFWASKVSDDNYGKQRMYRSYTTDFKIFTAPEIYIENESSAIDTTITSYKGVYYRFTKDETHSAVTMMSSTSLSHGWKDVETYTINGTAGNSVTGYEGPTIYKLNGEDKWCLLLDYYSKSQGYKPFVTGDITKGEFKSANDFKFDATYRHGTVMPITDNEYKSLTEKYGN